jgi:hypothetical protein
MGPDRVGAIDPPKPPKATGAGPGFAGSAPGRYGSDCGAPNAPDSGAAGGAGLLPANPGRAGAAAGRGASVGWAASGIVAVVPGVERLPKAGPTVGTPRAGVTAGRAACAMLRATGDGAELGALGAAGIDAAGR